MIALVATAITLTLGLGADPARAGQDVTIELKNELPKTEPLYPRLALRGTDHQCWYSNDFDRDDISAPAGGGYANFSSEVFNRFFSFCNPTWSPFKDSLVRWQAFKIVAQEKPGAPWVAVTWDDSQHFTFVMSYWKMVMDVRGYHFDLNGAAPGTVLQTPVGKACFTVEPRLFNYTDRFKMTVTPADAGTCERPATRGRDAIQKRNVRLQVDRSRHVVVGPVTSHVGNTTWKLRRGQCSNEHFTTEAVHLRRGPRGSRWQVVTVRGTSPGTDSCVLDLVGPRGQRLLSQKLAVTVS